MLDEIKNNLNQFSLPSKPKTFGQEYTFPEDIEKVSSPDLGSWMFKLAAWKGYSLRVLADLEIEKSWLKAKHDNRVARKIAQDSVDNKKITKDHALGQLILDDSEFRKIREDLIIRDTEVDSLKQVVEIYSLQIEVVSREISRRTLDLKLMQSGIVSNE
jgi:hypothetical protein